MENLGLYDDSDEEEELKNEDELEQTVDEEAQNSGVNDQVEESKQEISSKKK